MTSARTWRLRTVAQVADMSPRALRQCFETGALKLRGNDRKSTGSGSYVGLSKPRAYQVAVMKHLNRNGLPIPRSARAAFEFSDVGNIDRPPGELFEHGKTVLVIGPDSTTVRNIFSDTSFSDLSNRSPCCITVDLNSVVKQVDAALSDIS